MLCDSFTLTLTEFEQIFGLDDCSGVFSILDHDGNGLLDAIEVFTILILFSDSRLEDRIRFMFELYDFNNNKWLEEVDLSFMIYNCITGLIKMYNIQSESIDNNNSLGLKCYNMLLELISNTFPKQFKIDCNNLIMRQAEVLELKELF